MRSRGRGLIAPPGATPASLSPRGGRSSAVTARDDSMPNARLNTVDQNTVGSNRRRIHIRPARPGAQTVNARATGVRFMTMPCVAADSSFPPGWSIIWPGNQGGATGPAPRNAVHEARNALWCFVIDRTVAKADKTEVGFALVAANRNGASRSAMLPGSRTASVAGFRHRKTPPRCGA